MEPRALIAFASTHEQTRRIAGRIADTLRAEGVQPTVVEVTEAEDVDPSGFSVVIVGASIHGGSHQKEAVAWARRHAAVLSGMSSAFFSVSLTAAEDTADARRTVRRFVDEFVDETGWTPAVSRSFAGALQYREYNLPTKILMRVLMKRGNHPTDTSRDYDYTDWEAVRAFARTCVDLVAHAGRRVGSWESSAPIA